MKKLVVYVHGQGGNRQEADHYTPLFKDCDVTGFEYTSRTPWDAVAEFKDYFDTAFKNYESVILIANSLGAFFAMNALQNYNFEMAYFISPVVNMEKLITDMMMWAGVSEEQLCQQGTVETSFGQTLSWEYLCYVRNNKFTWNVPTHILYGEKDNMTSFSTISEFAHKTNSTLTVMADGEHWFHTPEQMNFLDSWIKKIKNADC